MSVAGQNTKWFLRLLSIVDLLTTEREQLCADQGKCRAAKSYEKNVRKATLYKRNVCPGSLIAQYIQIAIGRAVSLSEEDLRA